MTRPNGSRGLTPHRSRKHLDASRTSATESPGSRAFPGTRLDEILVFAGGVRGLAVDLEADSAGCFLLGGEAPVAAGSRVRGTVPWFACRWARRCWAALIDPLGNPLDDGGPIEAERMDPIDRPAPRIIDRDLVTQPLYTGLMVIDAMFPIGRGQRELIIGDRSTGKSAIGVDTIINQTPLGRDFGLCHDRPAFFKQLYHGFLFRGASSQA